MELFCYVPVLPVISITLLSGPKRIKDTLSINYYAVPALPLISINLLSGPKRIVNTLSVPELWVCLNVLKILGHDPMHMPLGSPLTLWPSIRTTNGLSVLVEVLESTKYLGTWISSAPPYGPGFTAASKACLAGSASIPTSEPCSIC